MNTILARRLEASDLPLRHQWLNDPSIHGQMLVSPPVGLAETQQWFSKTLLNESRRDFVFTLDGAAPAEAVAMGGLTDIHPRHRRAELYIFVRPGMTGRGIGSRATVWLCEYGYSELDLNRIYLHTTDLNDAARRLYARLGFKDEGTLRGHAFHRGRFIDRHVQGVLRSEWRKPREEREVPG
jgi:RimJ/RimL family protein N-acetyltransferase